MELVASLATSMGLKTEIGMGLEVMRPAFTVE